MSWTMAAALQCLLCSHVPSKYADAPENRFWYSAVGKVCLASSRQTQLITSLPGSICHNICPTTCKPASQNIIHVLLCRTINQAVIVVWPRLHHWHALYHFGEKVAVDALKKMLAPWQSPRHQQTSRALPVQQQTGQKILLQQLILWVQGYYN